MKWDIPEYLTLTPGWSRVRCDYCQSGFYQTFTNMYVTARGRGPSELRPPVHTFCFSVVGLKLLNWYSGDSYDLGAILKIRGFRWFRWFKFRWFRCYTCDQVIYIWMIQVLYCVLFWRFRWFRWFRFGWYWLVIGSRVLRGEGCLNILSWSWSTHYDCIVETLNKVGWISVCGGIPTISQRQGTGDTPLLTGIWANQRPVSWSRDHSQPIRGQYAGHHPGIWARFHSIEDYRHTHSMASNSSNISNKLKRENSRREWICGH